MSVNWSATSMRSDEVLPRKLMTSSRTPVSWCARMAGAQSPSPDSPIAMSRLSLTLPSPYLRMSLLTTL
jgi:hypothetical protein